MKRGTVYEYSAGAVVFTRKGNEVLYAIIRSKTGTYGFAKGHIEDGESEEEAALREVREETGLSIRLIDGFVRRDEYPLPTKKPTRKRVVYFLGEFSDQTPTPQPEEISSVHILGYAEAYKRLQFENLRAILRSANSFIEENCK